MTTEMFDSFFFFVFFILVRPKVNKVIRKHKLATTQSQTLAFSREISHSNRAISFSLTWRSVSGLKKSTWGAVREGHQNSVRFLEIHSDILWCFCRLFHISRLQLIWKSLGAAIPLWYFAFYISLRFHKIMWHNICPTNSCYLSI